MSAAAPAEGTPAPIDTAPTGSHVEATPPADTPPAQESKSTEPTKLWTDPPSAEAKPQETNTPEWFMKDKYKTIEDQAKARYDLEKLMGKNWGAPKDDYSTEGLEGISATDPLLEHIKPHLKELGLSQNGFAALMKGYTQAQLAMAEKIEAEVTETLTKTEAMTVQAVDKWLQSAFSENDRKTIQSWIVSVDDFRLLNNLRLMLPSPSSVPSSTAGNAVKFESSKEVTQEKIKYRQEVSQGLRVADKNFENELQQRFRDAAQREQNAKK
jgi:hypothetical protein